MTNYKRELIVRALAHAQGNHAAATALGLPTHPSPAAAQSPLHWL